MPLKTAKKKIGSTTYEYTQQPLTPAMEILSFVTKHLGEPLVPLLRGGLDSNIPGEALERAASSLVSKVGDSALMLELVKRLNVGGKAHFAGSDGQPRTVVLAMDESEIFFAERPDEVLPWVAFALEMQVGPFFGSVLRSLGLDHQKIEALTKKAKDLSFLRASSSAEPSSDSQVTDAGKMA